MSSPFENKLWKKTYFFLKPKFDKEINEIYKIRKQKLVIQFFLKVGLFVFVKVFQNTVVEIKLIENIKFKNQIYFGQYCGRVSVWDLNFLSFIKQYACIKK